MSERKINLEEIFKKQNPTDTGTIPDWVRDLCIEACRQTLELAAENYIYNLTFESDSEEYLKQSILNTINQIE